MSRLAELGAYVEEADPDFTDPVDAFHTLWFSGAARVAQHLGPEQRELLDPGLREIVRGRARGLARWTTWPRWTRGWSWAAAWAASTSVRPAGHADAADHRVRGGRGGAEGLRPPPLDGLDPVHVPVQPDPAARGDRARAGRTRTGCRSGCSWSPPGTGTRWCCGRRSAVRAGLLTRRVMRLSSPRHLVRRKLSVSPVAPDRHRSLHRLGHLVEPFDHRAPHDAGYPAHVPVDQQVVALVEQGQVDDRTCGRGGRPRVVVAV